MYLVNSVNHKILFSEQNVNLAKTSAAHQNVKLMQNSRNQANSIDSSSSSNNNGINSNSQNVNIGNNGLNGNNINVLVLKPPLPLL